MELTVGDVPFDEEVELTWRDGEAFGHPRGAELLKAKARALRPIGVGVAHNELPLPSGPDHLVDPHEPPRTLDAGSATTEGPPDARPTRDRWVGPCRPLSDPQRPRMLPWPTQPSEVLLRPYRAFSQDAGFSTPPSMSGSAGYVHAGQVSTEQLYL